MKSLSLKRLTGMLSILAVLTQSCGGGGLFGGGSVSDEGELTGSLDRPEWDAQVIPIGMTNVPGGTFHMGQADEDITYSMINMNKQVTISGFFMDETEITNNEYRQFIEGMEAESDTSADWTYEQIQEELRPDTTVWEKDFSYHMGEPMQDYYYSHPAFDEYPVVGVTRRAAVEFCAWRTRHLNSYRIEQGQAELPAFRLPTEAEWEYAARGGLDMAKYPWGGPYVRNGKGCALANFKPGRGNYYDDGYSYTSPVGAYFPNGFGLYDMSGNVAEWCDDAYNPAGYPIVWDLNPTYTDPNEPKKIVRGGSWKDIPFYIQTGTRSYEFETQARSYIGFRCAMINLGRSSGFEF
ncbi:SUMF1/EgtB/PvdO family nonheme iron enzyme [Flammeovirga yaeyamensis]|uniref:SUMF1/EgtB/PvdO family nonheme iron enzyme n=2 Tax=Flammeovirga yaeyamensis TaxID=367791 RepID=A0AAX1N418_9BACT|nr:MULTISPECIES: SUMF1/EgtB/PvdO family nonheme iron enzyme [Flammeovirga]ANQ50635.2 SUMF1/EgtB/PvdO family nonheme iron enzyme [Flammeovirga sp. MY04]MBB3700983.1 gliding motility-associated lipoprotein GldK [Flammeovirga yaeyamensis]NMF38183.1 SUMF1/EgtB/PvdO family nonheme iron enzyme [Flammeovirga yaeyamensis]QWG01952.1 SUMF1/EgtB/PvdO family nonheme iron enzyme [Flammeovirga yaeyamensis]